MTDYCVTCEKYLNNDKKNIGQIHSELKDSDTHKDSLISQQSYILHGNSSVLYQVPRGLDTSTQCSALIREGGRLIHGARFAFYLDKLFSAVYKRAIRV